MVADALSRCPADSVVDALDDSSVAALRVATCALRDATVRWAPTASVAALERLSLSVDSRWLDDVRNGYTTDSWCVKLRTLVGQMGISERNGLLYIADRLVVPDVARLRESLFHLAHDALGHFGFDKSYAALRDAYYWPHMRKQLEKMYIPACEDCQRNKSTTRRAPGPLHPLPVPEGRCRSIALDWIGPLPPDSGFDSLCTVLCRLGSAYRLIPTTTTASAADFALAFFDRWYCDFGLPMDIVSDRDKLFLSSFWKSLHTLTGVKLKMSTSFHPQTDGTSERTNKTVIQALRYHVARNQTGWVRALPRVQFAIMNTVNASTGFSPFQLLMGMSPHVIPPLTSQDIAQVGPSATDTAEVIRAIETNVMEAQDNLLLAKVHQALMANVHRGAEIEYAVGDRVLLSTFHRRRDYMQRGDHRVAKFMVRWDGPYDVIHAYPETSVYTLDLPPSMAIFPTFHGSLLKRYVPNDGDLFPSREHARPGPIVTADGEEEFEVDSIINRRRRGRGWQYLVRWKGYGPGADTWLPGAAVDDLKALDEYLDSL